MALLAKVGSFAKSTDAAPASQAVTGVGFEPKVLWLWTAGGTAADTWRDDYRGAHGWAVGTGSGEARSMAYADGPPNGSFSDSSVRIANKALTIVAPSETLLAECDLTSFDADGFTLNWTTNNGNGYIIHYLALGGDAITNAAVVSWSSNSDTGNQSVTGVGFEPNLALHMLSRLASVPSTNTWQIGGVGLGAMDGTNEWAVSWIADENRFGSTRNWRQQRTDRTALSVGDSEDESPSMSCSFVSFDADGFTVNIEDSQQQKRVFSLCLDIQDAAVGSFAKPTDAAPASHQEDGLGFEPAAIWLSSFMLPAVSSQQDHARVGFGASDGESDHAAATLSEHSTSSSTDLARDGIDLTSVAYRKVNNASRTTDAEGTVTLDSDGFTLELSTNDGDADEILYLALGPAAADSGSGKGPQRGLPTIPSTPADDRAKGKRGNPPGLQRRNQPGQPSRPNPTPAVANAALIPSPVAPVLSHRMRHAQVTVEDTTTLILAANGRATFVVANEGDDEVFIGDSEVSVSNGFPIPAGDAMRLDLEGELWGVVASGTVDVRIIEEL